MAAAYSEMKPIRPLQIARIRKEEEEENWISGEELHTDGSSDEEGGGGEHSRKTRSCQKQLLARRISAPAHLQRQIPPPPPEASEPVTQDEPHLTETSRRLSKLGSDLQIVEEELPTNIDSSCRRKTSEGSNPAYSTKDEVEEQDEVMLWRPKRGSIKLPHHVDQDPTPPPKVPG